MDSFSLYPTYALVMDCEASYQTGPQTKTPLAYGIVSEACSLPIRRSQR